MSAERVLGIRIKVDASGAGAAANEATAALNKVKGDLGTLEQQFGSLNDAQRRYLLGQYQSMQAAAGNRDAVRALQAAMQGFNTEQTQALLTMGKLADGAKKGQESHEGLFGAVLKGNIATELAKKAWEALVGVYNDARESTRQLQQENLRVDSVMTATGRSAEGLGARIRALAQGLQESTGVSDDAVKRSGAVLATFTGIAGQNFERTIRLAGDLAAVFGGDLTSRTEQVARALTEPGTSLGQLERQFGKFSPALKAAVKDLVEMNEVGQAQKLILDELEGRVGGAAVNSYRGLERQITGTKNAWDDLLRAMGNRVFDAQSTEASFFERQLRGLQRAVEEFDLNRAKEILIMMATPAVSAVRLARYGAKMQEVPKFSAWSDDDQISRHQGRDTEREVAAYVEARERAERAGEGINKIIEDTRDKRTRLNDDLAKVNKLTMDRLLMADSAESAAKIIADMDAATQGLQSKYAERKAKDTHDTSAQWAKAALDYSLGVAKGDLEAVKGYLDETGKAIEDAHKAGLISEQSYWERKAQLVEDGVAATENALQDELQAVYAEQNELIAARTKAAGNAKEVDRINLELAKTDTKVLEIDTRLEANQRKMGEAARIRAQGTQAAWDAQRKMADEVQRAVEPEKQQLEALQRANEQWGFTPVQIAQANLALAENNLQLAFNAEIVGNDTAAWGKNVAIMQERVRIARDGVGATQIKASLETETENIRNLYQTTEQVAKSFFDGLTDGAGNAAQRMKDAFKRLFFDWIWTEFAKKQVMNLFISATGISASQANAAGLVSTSTSGLTQLFNGVGNWFGGGSSSAAGGGPAAWNQWEQFAGGATGGTSSSGSWLTSFTNVFTSSGTGGSWLSAVGSLFSAFGSSAGKVIDWVKGFFGFGGMGATPAAIYGPGAAAEVGSAATGGTGLGVSGVLGAAGIGAILGGFLGPMVSKDERAGTAGTIGGAVGGVIGSAAAAWLVGAEAGSIAGPIGTIVGAVIGAVIGALSTGDGIAQRVAKFVTGSGKDYTYQGSSQFGQFGIERGSDKWFSDAEMKTTLDGWMQSITLLDNTIAKHLTPGQIGQVQGALGGTGGSTYGFGMEHQDIPGGTFGAIVRERYTAVFSVLDAAMAKMISGFEGTTEDLLKLIGDLTTVHFTLEQQGAAIAALIGEGLDITKLQGFKQEGESYTQTLQRVVEIYAVTNEVARAMGKTVEAAFGGVGLATESLREQLVDEAGGTQALASALQAYYGSFFTAQERAKMQLADVTAGFKLLGIEMPLTKEEFRHLVDGLDLTTESERHTFVELMKLAPGFAAVADSADALAAAAIAAAQAGMTVAASLHTTTAALFGVGEAGKAAMDDLVTQAGGTQNLGQLVGGYTQGFFSPKQQADLSRASLGQQFADLGVEMPTTKQGFMDLIGGLKLTTESGRHLLIELLKLAPGLAQVIDATSAQIEADQALVDVGRIVAATMGTTSAALFGTGAAGKAAMESLAGLVGGTQNLAQLISGYQTSFLTAQERYSLNLGDLRSRFHELGVEMPTTKAGFAAMVQGLDLTTERGRVLYAALLQLSPQFASVADYADQLRTKTQALLDGMQEYAAFDPAAAIQQAMHPEDLVQAWQRTGVELRQVISLYDGSEAAQQRIAEATQRRYQSELQLVQAIADAVNGVNGLAKDTIRSMTLQTLDNPGKYNYYDREIVQLRARLAGATDPEEIKSLNERIIQDINAAFNLLDPAEQQAKLSEFTSRVELIRAEAEARLEATGATIAAEHTSLPDSIRTAIEASMAKIAEDMNKAAEGMGAAAGEMKDAGKAHKDAADTTATAAALMAQAAAAAKKVDVGIHVFDDRTETEVNG